MIIASAPSPLLAIGTGLAVLIGVYIIFAVLRSLADVAIFLIALADAFVAGSIADWYPRVAAEVKALPPEMNFKGWALCVLGLAVMGAIIALPLVPFSSINRDSGSPDKAASE